jgi:hypothetical protein
MQSMTIRLNDELMDWLKSQASLNHRSKNKQLEYLLSNLRKEEEHQRYSLGLSTLCHNGITTQVFKSCDK